MKRLFALMPFVLAASLATAQEQTTPPPAGPPPAAPPPAGLTGTERQFAGEIVTTDAAAKTLTVKTAVADAKGEKAEKTMTLAVADEVAPKLESLKTGDKVTVLWRRDEAQQRDVVVKVAKGEPVPPPQP